MTSQHVLEALGRSVIGAELKGDFTEAESVAVRELEAAEGPSRSGRALDLAIVRMVKGDLHAARAPLEEAGASGEHSVGHVLRALTSESVHAQLMFNYFPSGTGAAALELTCRGDEVADADWGETRWQELFDRDHESPDAIESLVLRRLFSLPLAARTVVAERRRTGGETGLIQTGAVSAILSVGEVSGLPPSYAAYSKRAAATVMRGAGDHDGAWSGLHAALDAYAEIGDEVGQAICLLTHGDWLAAPFSSPLPLDFATVESSSAGSDLDPRLEAAEARRHDADLEGARSAYSAALATLNGEPAPRARAALELRQSYLATVEAKFESAVVLAEAAERSFEASGDRFGQHVALAHAAHARVGAGKLPEDVTGARTIGEWGRTRGSFSYALGIGLTLGRCGRYWLIREGDSERALACYRLAGALYEELGAAPNAIQSIVDQGMAYRAVGESKTATVFFQDALQRMPDVVESRPAVEQDLRRRDLLVGLELSQLALPAPPSSSRKAHALELFAKLPREYDEMGRLLSFGEDRRWRKAMVRAIEASPTDRVLDVATGTGLVAAELVRRYGCSVVGIDQSDEMLARARRRLVREPRLSRRVELVRAEAEQLPFADGEFDAVTVGYLMRYVDDPAVTIAELARVVKPGGRVASVEFGVPSWRPALALWRLYTKYGLPTAGRVASRAWYDVARFLSHSIPDYYERYPLAHQCDFWHDAGIRSVHVRRMSFGAGVVIWGTRTTMPT